MTLNSRQFPYTLALILLIMTVLISLAFAQVATEADGGRRFGPAGRHLPSPASTPGDEPRRGGISEISSPEAGTTVWQVTGPFGGDVTILVIDPRNPDRILTGTSDGQIYQSLDGGKIWRNLRPGITAPGCAVTTILFDREQAGTIYAGVKSVSTPGELGATGNLFISEDSGATWYEVQGLRGRAIRGLAQSASKPETLVAAALDGAYRTRDRGRNWERITPLNNPEFRGFHSVAIDPRAAETIYIGTNHLPWKSLDGGQTWKRIGSKENGMIDDSDVFSIQIDESNPDSILLSACSGVYRSDNGSGNWSKFAGIPVESRRSQIIVRHPTRPERIFVGTTEGLWVSNSYGIAESWRRVTSEHLVINSVAIHPARPDRVLLGTEDGGVLISLDGGDSFNQANEGFINRQVSAVLADLAERGRLYVGILFDGEAGGLFVSRDGGLSWEQATGAPGSATSNLDIYSLYQSPFQTETIYAGTNAGIYRSDDHGVTWNPVTRSTPPIAANEDRELRRESVAKRKSARPIAVKKGRKVISRRVVPTNRTPPTHGPQTPPPHQLTDIRNQVFSLHSLTPLSGQTSPSTPGAPGGQWMLASTWDGLFLTEDEKKGWKKLSLNSSPFGRDPHIKTVATSPQAPGMILVGTEEGLYISTNNGESFREQPFSEERLRVRSIVFDPRTARTIYLGTSSGFFRSLDGGTTWEQRGGGMPLHTDASVIIVNDLVPDEIYLADDLRGTIYISTDRGTNWEGLDLSRLPSPLIRAFSIDPFDPKRVYLGTISGGVYVMNRR